MDKIKNILEQTKSKAKTWSIRRKVFYGFLLVIAILLLIKVFGGSTSQTYVFDSVVRTDLLQSVKATGRVTSKTDLSLSFNSSGVVKSVRVEVGSKVYQGQILATLDQGAESADVTVARGALASAQAKYNKTISAYTNEDIALTKVLLDNAKKAYTATVAEQNAIVEKYFNEFWKQNVDKRYVGAYDEVSNAEKARDSAVASAQALVDQRQAELNVKLASANSADVALANAEITQAQGKLEAALAKLEDTIIRAPANGTITKVDTKIGELSQVNTEVIVLQDISNLYIESDINEANIANVKLDQVAKFSFDAMPGKDFIGKVVHIDPSATTSDGVVNYKIKSSIPKSDVDIRVGMNANVVVIGGEKPGVLALPKQAVNVVDGKSMVKKVLNEKKKTFQDTEVVTGFLGDGNLIEIVSGLNEGDRITYTK